MGLGTSPAFVPRAGCVAQVAALALTIGHYVLTNSAWAEQTKPVRPLSREETMLPRARPEAVPAQRAGNGAAAILDGAELPENFRELAVKWQNIIVHQTEGPAGSAKSMALAQATNPSKRGVTVWVETDGTVYWSIAESAIPTHGDGANRNDNKYIDNSNTYRRVIKTNSIGVEFVGNYPDVAKPPTREQTQAWLILVRFLQERYGIPAENIYAHNWIDFKDRRYCEGCELATLARKLGYEPGKTASGQ